jgi:hypothetical protein
MTAQKVTTATVFAVAATGIVLTALVLGLLVTSQTFNNNGNIKGIGICVYSDSQCTTVLSSINWGYLEPGTTKNVAIYILNNGSVPVELTMTTNNWFPTSATGCMSLSWNCSGHVLSKESSVPALLTLSVYSNATEIESFSFDITLIGTEHT